MPRRRAIDPPDLPELQEERLDAASAGELVLSGVRVHEGNDVFSPAIIRIDEAELVGLALDANALRELSLSDVVMIDCDLSNLHGRGGTITRTHVTRSRLVGFAVTEGRIQDVRVEDSTMMLASFAHSRLRGAVFERVNLREASFLEATMDWVSFIDCDLTGADFRGAKLRECVIRGASLEEVIGVESLEGLSMPWPDVVASAGALAGALGIAIEPE